jgi:23S rRNA pseudouridine2605 synthase
MRLNRFLASCGLGSRRRCESFILEGSVTLNGKTVTNLATQVQPGDEVACEGKRVASVAVQTVMLHKPPGVLCTRSDPAGRATIYNLLPPPLRQLHHVGRLDNDSEGLLILTNDGELTQKLSHPSQGVQKEYWVALASTYDPADTPKLLAGIPLEEGVAVMDRVRPISPRHLSVTLHQGMHRQVRRMFAALEYKVVRLARVRMGGLELGSLKPGKWRVLHEPELAKLLTPSGSISLPAVNPAIARLPRRQEGAARRRSPRTEPTEGPRKSGPPGERRPDAKRRGGQFPPGRKSSQPGRQRRDEATSRSGRPPARPRSNGPKLRRK